MIPQFTTLIRSTRISVGLPVAIVLAVATATPDCSRADEYEIGQLQLELAPGASIQSVNARYATTTLDSLPPLYLLDVPEGATEDQLLGDMANDPDIIEAEYSWENETPEGTRQMMVAAVGGTITDYLDQNVVQRLHLAEIQQHMLGEGVIVAVLDTGVLANHPALEGAILPGGYDFVDDDSDPTDSANGVDDDLDGFIDEGAGHGTMVAGIIHLVAPAAQILPIRVLNDEGSGGTFDVAKAIRYAVEHGAHVINMSLGLTHRSGVIAHELDTAENLAMPMISAAGNLGQENPVYFPGSDSHVLNVTALDSSDVKADFSNWNSDVNVSAPGVGILAPFHDGEYAIGAGTSFAVPFISGQCALLRSMSPLVDLDQIYTAVEGGVVDIYNLPGNEPYNGKLGSGRFDGLQTWIEYQYQTSDVGDGITSLAADVSAYPNPSSRGSDVVFHLGCLRDGSGGDLLITVLDVQGRRLRVLTVPDRAGEGSLRWDGLDERGNRLPAGIYLVRIRRPWAGGDSREVTRLRLIRF